MSARNASSSSSPTPTTPTSALPGRSPSGFRPGPSRAWCAARAATPARTTPRSDPLELAKTREASSAPRPPSSATKASISSIGPTARSKTTWRCASSSCASSAQFKPDAVVCMDPTVIVTRGRLHPARRPSQGRDGRHRCRLPRVTQRDGVPAPRPGRGPRAAQRRHRVHVLHRQADTWVDTSDTIEVKIAALREHTSQLRKPEKLEEMLRGWSAEDGQKIGTAAAESFRLLKMDR